MTDRDRRLAKHHAREMKLARDHGDRVMARYHEREMLKRQGRL